MTTHRGEREKRETLSKTSLYCIEDSTEDRQKKIQQTIMKSLPTKITLIYNLKTLIRTNYLRCQRP